MYVHSIFIGHHKERLMESIKHWQTEYPPRKFVLLTGEERTSGEARADTIAKEMQQELQTPLYDVIIHKVSKLDLIKTISQLSEVISSLKKEGYQILLNISGSLRIFTVAAMIVAYLTQSELVSAIPRYDENFNEIGVEEHIKIPVLPLTQLNEEQITILSKINSGVDSVGALVLKISPDCKKDKKKYRSERSRITYYLNSLEEAGFLFRKREGKNTRIQLTELGSLYSLKQEQ